MARPNPTIAEVATHLTDELDLSATDVTPLYGGTWSRCFGFIAGHQSLVLRVGNHPDDFDKEVFAQRFASAALPVPQVLARGVGFGAEIIVTTRAAGRPLEWSTPNEWRALVPAVVGALGAMRTTVLADDTGWGRWNAHGMATHRSWREFLLAVEQDSPGHRLHGWRAVLDRSPRGRECFAWGHRLLAELDLGEVPHSLVHADLINRNVHVRGSTLSGVFDWGGALWGDHLYDVAWFEMWRPWHPNLDVGALREALYEAWSVANHRPTTIDERRVACLLHIGLEHLAYNAHIGDERAVEAVAARTEQLVDQMSS